MVTVRYGDGVVHEFVESDDLVAVRTKSRRLMSQAGGAFAGAMLTDEARDILTNFEVQAGFREAGVEVFRTRSRRGRLEVRDRARSVLKQEPEVRFAGRVLQDPTSKEPVLYTENLFVKFPDKQSNAACERALKRAHLRIKRPLDYATRAYFVEAEEGIGTEVFAVALDMLDSGGADLCHPELIREARRRAAFDRQWHLKRTTIAGTVVDGHASVEDSWAMSTGEGIVIAVIDDGVDVAHEEFQSAQKIVAPFNASAPPNVPSDDPRPGSGDNHGTACAGVACADGVAGASGVAPKARLMPIRLASALGSQAEADAFVHAARHGADVISCSWGPIDGAWFNPNDPVHNQDVPMPDSTRLAIKFAIDSGRDGKGCVITWAAGNGNEDVGNDGYASSDMVVAVAACNDTGTKSVYSDKGDAIWCAFPSNDIGHAPFSQPAPKTTGIWTTDRSGADGYNAGDPSQGDPAGNYTNDFGGTSSACPGAAGVAALVLERNPALRWDQVKDVLKRSCDRIDEAGGNYDGSGHSPLYGYGRLNALTAVQLALPARAAYTVVHRAIQDVDIKDMKTSELAVEVADTTDVPDLAVSVDIEHTFIGDLIVTIRAPGGSARLHDRSGAGQGNINRRYDTVNTPTLAALAGANPAGTWTLEVSDNERRDVGRIRSFEVELLY